MPGFLGLFSLGNIHESNDRSGNFPGLVNRVGRIFDREKRTVFAAQILVLETKTMGGMGGHINRAIESGPV